MKISRTVAYAVQAVLQIAQNNSDVPIPCSQLATEGHMPERFLLQILRHLVTHGILHSTRGVDGGYSLERPADEISLLDVIEAIEGPVGVSVPESNGNGPMMCETRLRKALEDVATSSRRHLEAIKLSDLISGPALAKLA
jgi:Rrf2 family transcriptional regulator, cysteine metabolism repressor